MSKDIIPCSTCMGDGKVITGEYLVTPDMAIDACDKRLEGAHHSYQWGDCPVCGGTGIER